MKGNYILAKDKLTPRKVQYMMRATTSVTDKQAGVCCNTEADNVKVITCY